MANNKNKVPIELRGQAEDKKKALETAIAQIEKNYGRGAIMRLGDDIPVSCEALSTGSLSLDMALGIGGVPKGRIVEIYGPEPPARQHLHCILWLRHSNPEEKPPILMSNTHWSLLMQQNWV